MAKTNCPVSRAEFVQNAKPIEIMFFQNLFLLVIMGLAAPWIAVQLPRVAGLAHHLGRAEHGATEAERKVAFESLRAARGKAGGWQHRRH